MNVLISGGALAVAGTSVIGTVAAGIVANTGTLLSYLWYGSSTNVQLRDYHRRISKLDIQDKVKLIDAMLEANAKDPFTKLMEAGVRAVTEDILRQLSDINSKIADHKEKWFSGYRNLYIDEEIKDLEALTTVLDKKICMLQKL
jgi:hypothetical protein